MARFLVDMGNKSWKTGYDRATGGVVCLFPIVVLAILLISFTWGSSTQWIIPHHPPPHSTPPLTCGSATLRIMGTPHLNFLFLRWVRHFLHSTTSQLLEMSPVSEAHCTYISLSLQNLANLGLLHHEIFAFAEFWQVTYQKLLQISGIKPFRGSFPVELFWWRNLGAWNRFLERHLHSIILKRKKIEIEIKFNAYIIFC